VQLQERYVSLFFDRLTIRCRLPDPVIEGDTLCIENPFDVSVPIGSDDRHLERLAQSDCEAAGVEVREALRFPKPAEDPAECRRVIIRTKIVARFPLPMSICVKWASRDGSVIPDLHAKTPS
jgi:hypothetical protein